MNGLASPTPWLLVAAAVLCNAAAQVLIKHAGVTDAGDWRQWFTWSLSGAAMLYVLSFGVTALVYARMPLSLASPLMAGAIFMLVTAASVMLFAETLNPMRIAGIACVVVGIFLLSQSR